MNNVKDVNVKIALDILDGKLTKQYTKDEVRKREKMNVSRMQRKIRERPKTGKILI